MHFFVFEDMIKKFQKSPSAAAKEEVPGSAYIQNILSFYENHYIHGELFMEFIKDGFMDATGELCKYCQVNGIIRRKDVSHPSASTRSTKTSPLLVRIWLNLKLGGALKLISI